MGDFNAQIRSDNHDLEGVKGIKGMERITDKDQLFIENCAVNNIIGVFRINSSINVHGSLKIILLLIRSIILRLIGNDVDL